MRKQRRQSVTNVMEQIVFEDPQRTGLWLQNVEDTTFSIYAKEDNPYGGMYLYKGDAIYFDRSTDAHKDWWCKTVLAGAKSIRIIEFYDEEWRRRP